MKKSEIKDGIKLITSAINTARENMKEYLKPYEDIKEHLQAIQSIEEENCLDIGLDYESVAIDTLRSCITESADIQEVEEQLDYLISDLENWAEESSEKKAEQIQEDYIDVLSEIKDNFEIDSMDCDEDLDNQLFDLITALEEVII